MSARNKVEMWNAAVRTIEGQGKLHLMPQSGYAEPLSETSYQQILDELRNKGLNPQQAGQRRLDRSKSEVGKSPTREALLINRT